MNIADQFLKIGIFLAHNGFVTILKEMPMSLVTAIKTDGVACKEPSHHCG